MSWPRLARSGDLVDSLVWRGDDRATEYLNFHARVALPSRQQPKLQQKWYCQTADPSRAGDRTPYTQPSQRGPAAAHEKRGVVIEIKLLSNLA